MGHLSSKTTSTELFQSPLFGGLSFSSDSVRDKMALLVPLNISQPDLDWNDKYDFLRGKPGPKILLAVMVTLSYLIGTFLTLAQIFYEKYGEDPQKSSLVNQVTFLCL